MAILQLMEIFLDGYNYLVGVFLFPLTNSRKKSPASTSGEMNCASDEGGAFFVPLASLTIF
jgi:hypothetical protein